MTLATTTTATATAAVTIPIDVDACIAAGGVWVEPSEDRPHCQLLLPWMEDDR